MLVHNSTTVVLSNSNPRNMVLSSTISGLVAGCRWQAIIASVGTTLWQQSCKNGYSITKKGQYDRIHCLGVSQRSNRNNNKKHRSVLLKQCTNSSPIKMWQKNTKDEQNKRLQTRPMLYKTTTVQNQTPGQWTRLSSVAGVAGDIGRALDSLPRQLILVIIHVELTKVTS